MSIFDLYHPDALEELKRVFEVFKKTGEVHDQELPIRRRNGEKLWVSVNVSARSASPCRLKDSSGFRVPGSEFRVPSSGFRVPSFSALLQPPVQKYRTVARMIHKFS